MFQSFISYFETLDHRPLERLLFLVAGMLLLWSFEGGIPLLTLQYKRNKVRHATINLSFTAIHLVIHTGFAVFIVFMSDWSKAVGFGFIHWFNASVVAGIIITILVLDFFGGWLVHFTEHKLRWLWHFHIIHHTDNNVDVTTALRHHPVESVLRGLFFLAGVVVAGAPMYAVMIFQTLLIVAAQFTHANISLPAKLDQALSWIIVSPNMHKVHHHFQLPFTDSNYGAIFSIWDRALGTFRTLHAKDIIYGIDKQFPNEKDEDFFEVDEASVDESLNRDVGIDWIVSYSLLCVTPCLSVAVVQTIRTRSVGSRQPSSFFFALLTLNLAPKTLLRFPIFAT